MDTQLYQGNGIFRNQPSYKVFNKSFEDADDTLFTQLNELDVDVYKEEQQTFATEFEEYSSQFACRDPRTQQVVERSVYDHTTDKLPFTFPNKQQCYSTLSRDEQAACLRVLLAWQQNTVVQEDDFVIWRVTNNKRCKEQELVQKHIFDYANAEQERIYAPMQQLVLLYRQWFQLRTARLLKRLPNLSYITHTGLPQLSQCKGLNTQTANMVDIKEVCRSGHVPCWPEVRIKQEELSTLRIRLERYSSQETETDIVQTTISNDLEKQLETAQENVYVLPLDALLLLLAPGAYVDLPTEMLLHIRELDDSDNKCIEFQQPMPARHCGCHTNSRILTEAYNAYASTQWPRCSPECAVQINNSSTLADCSPPQTERLRVYKLQPIDQQTETRRQPKSNLSLVSWRLQCENSTAGLQLYTSLPITAVIHNLAHQPLGCHFIKLESKPECGLEAMTKIELLRAWLQLKLLRTELGHCTRIALQDFSLLLEQPLSLSSLEQQLLEYHHINLPQLLAQLEEFLKILSSIAPGEYLLRYTLKYKDKFLLCRTTSEPATQSFKLHDLLTETVPSKLQYLTQSYLPILPQLCSIWHEQQQLLPCAFPPKKKGVKLKPKVEPQPELVQRTSKPKNKSTTKRKLHKINQKRRKRAALKAQQDEDKKLEQIMHL
ncbi:Ice2 [Drosophila busckii]|uniref:Ice2 n=1 Tax=Drosophila busckii TaxID=30019 RepID=A0A0M3QY02_DROBS|nr:little elongation complex subunit 2 [Drosophila busckii]ALC46769.1 Ice2 [Drosophila busckii]